MSSNSIRKSLHSVGIVSTCLPIVAATYLCMFCFTQTIHAGIVVTGDVQPANPATWRSSTDAYIGKYSTGTLSVTSGSDILSSSIYIGNNYFLPGEATIDGDGSTWIIDKSLFVRNGKLNITNGGRVTNVKGGYIGYSSGTAGEVTVDGNNSVWINYDNLYIGYRDTGTLKITNGGTVVVDDDTWMSYEEDSSSAIYFDNGILTTDGFLGDFNNLTGTGTINTQSIVSNIDLVFDATHGLHQIININQNVGQNITLNLNVYGSGSMGAGYSDTGTMSISDGVVVDSDDGYIGYQSNVAGQVTINGVGSTWNVNDNYGKDGRFCVGYFGDGTLNITDGGKVRSYRSHIGFMPGSMGVVTVDGVNSTWINDDFFRVGSHGNGTLNITNGGKVNNDDNGYIGYAPGSTGEVTIDGVGSTWTNRNELHVGYQGNGILNITGGGVSNNNLLSGSSFIGYYSGSTGEVTVNGAGSTWANNGLLVVGNEGSGTLNITGGGSVSNRGGYTTKEGGYIGYKVGSTGEVTVDGTDSTWTSSYSLLIGHEGNGTLNITNGGEVSNYKGYIGHLSGSAGEVTVDGADSTWTNSSSLYIGHESNGTLDVTNGGAVSNSNGYIGYLPGSTGEVTVDGVGSTWTNSSSLYIGSQGNGILNIINGGTVIVEEDILIPHNPGASGVINFNNGTLTTNRFLGTVDDLTGMGTINTQSIFSEVAFVFDATHGMNQTFTLNENVGQNITVNISIDSSNDMIIGYDGAGTMSVSDGVTVESPDGYIGYNSGSTGEVTINGIGSTWMNNNNLYVGYEGSGTLNIAGGGSAVSGGIRNTHHRGYIGYESGSTGEVTVDGVGSTFKNSNILYIGHEGTGILNITDGGAVDNDRGYIGYSSDSVGEVTIDGVNSTWTNHQLYIGNEGNGTLNITSGGTVSSQYSYIGDKSGSMGEVTIDGAGSTWTHSNLYIGREGNGKLNITGGGVVSSYYSYIGNSSGSMGEVTVDGTDSTWTTSGPLVVGYSGRGTLNITAGSNVASNGESEVIGRNSGSIGVVTVDGADSMWTSNGKLFIGYFGNGTLNTTEGGAVSVGAVAIGDQSGSTGITTVDGANSILVIGNELLIGNKGNGTLNITNGGTVTVQEHTWLSINPNSSGAIHFDNGTLTTGNFIGAGDALTGTGTINTHSIISDIDLVFDATHGLSQTFSINNNAEQNITVNLHIDGSGSMGVGYGGVGTMSISDGIVIESTDSYIGYKSGSTGEVTVEGTDSAWTSDFFYLGYEGSGTLNITNGGAVSNGHAHIGYKAGSMGEVTVDGIGSTWTNDSLSIGRENSGTMNITGGGAVSNEEGYIAYLSGSTGEVTVDGVGSTWTNNRELNIGRSGSGTLNITGGGSVSNDNGYIGYYSNSTSEVTVNGTGSIWTNSADLYIGHKGKGTLNITGGGAVNNVIGFIGDQSSSMGSVVVDGVGSIWTNNDDLNIGHEGNGTLTIINGGAVNNTIGYIGDKSSSTGWVTVDGIGSTWTNNNDLYVGHESNGALNITSGGTVNNTFGYIGKQSGSTGEVTVDGSGSTWVNNNNISVGYEGSGTLNITDGGEVSSHNGYIGHLSDSTGEVTINGDGSMWSNSGSLYTKRGNLNITNGGAVSNSSYGAISSTGEITVNGSNSIWMNGDKLLVSSGRLNIMSGGTVTVQKDTWINHSADSSGTVYFDNGTLTTGGLFCDFDSFIGTGTINTHGLVRDDVDLVFDATHGLSRTFHVNENTGQNVTVNLNVDGSGSMGAGYNGVGTMSIYDGKVVASTDGYIGYNPGSTGTVTVDGFGSSWTNSGDLYVGSRGSGTLNITNGGAVTVLSNTWVSRYLGSSGTIGFDNGTLTTGSLLGTIGDLTGTGMINTNGLVSDVDLVFDATHGLNQTLTIDENPGQNITINLHVDGSGAMGAGYSGVGTMSIYDGKVIESYGGYIGYNSGSTGTVTVDGNGSTWTNRESLIFGYYNGTLNITDGGLVSVAERLYVGFRNNNYINIASDGMLALYGDTDESLSDFLRQIPGWNVIRYWDDSVSDWADIAWATYGEDYTLSYMTEGDLAGYTVLTVTAVILGDVNGDGVIDGFDVDPFVDVLLNGPYMAEADINKDGLVNGFDIDPFVTLIIGGGTGGSGGGGNERGPQGVEIPEPTTLVLLGLAGLISGRRHY